MKTKEELNAIKAEMKALNEKFAGLTKEELQQVLGGAGDYENPEKFCKYCSRNTAQMFVGLGFGWDEQGEQHNCEVWQCQECRGTNYYDIHTGELI